MLFELYDIDISPVLASVVFGAVMGLVFGAAAQISRFCLRRGLVGRGQERSQALGVWLTALVVAVIGTQIVVSMGYVSFADHRLHVPEVPVLAVVLGGLLFGVGMVLTRGCVSRLTVLSATGNLRAVTVLLVFAVVAHATLKGLLAPLRVAAGSVTVDLGEAASLGGLPGGATVWSALLAVGAVALVARSGARPLYIAMAALIGALVPLGWFGTGAFLMDEFDPIPLASMSFTAPWADTLFWSIASTSIPAGFGTGLIGGVLAGSFLAAALRGELSLASFETPQQTLRYAAGAALMGFGGVLAGGCTVGAGLSGVGSLSVAALLALAAIMAGARIADRLLDRTASAPTAFPAE